MKLLRHGPIGQERPGAIDPHGQLRDLSLLVPDCWRRLKFDPLLRIVPTEN